MTQGLTAASQVSAPPPPPESNRIRLSVNGTLRPGDRLRAEIDGIATLNIVISSQE